MSDDGSHHVLYTDNRLIMVFKHSGGSLTYASEQSHAGLVSHKLNSSVVMYRNLKGSTFSTSIIPGGEGVVKWNYTSSNGTYN